MANRYEIVWSMTGSRWDKGIEANLQERAANHNLTLQITAVKKGLFRKTVFVKMNGNYQDLVSFALDSAYRGASVRAE